MGGLDGNVVGHAQLQLGATVDDKRVGEIGGVAGLIVVIAVVAQEAADALTLGIEAADDKGVALMDLGLGGRGVDEAVGLGREAEIAHAVEGVEASGVHVVGYLGGLGVLLLDDVVADVSVEIAVVVEHALGNLCAQFGIDPRHEYGLLAEGLGHPFCELGVAVVVVVPDGQSHGERHAVVAAAEDGAVGCGGQCGLDLLLRLGEVLRRHLRRDACGVGEHVVVVGDFLQSGEELVALGDVLRHGTGDEEDGSRQQEDV